MSSVHRTWRSRACAFPMAEQKLSTGSVEVDTLIEAFDRQIGGCELLGSRWTAAILRVARDDLQRDGITRALFADYRLPPHPSAAALRLAGGLNASLADAAAADADESLAVLAALHPERRAGGEQVPGFERAVLDALESARATILDFLARPVQTNEVQRSGALVPGLLEVAQRTGLPLDLFEIGSSGGLNLLCDRFACRFGSVRVGPEANAEDAVRVEPTWSGELGAVAPGLDVRARRGVDLTPLDLRDPAVARRGRAYVWPDQHRRLANFDAAVRMLASSDVQVEADNAAQWLPSVLAERADGACAVVMHSIMWQYMPPEDRAAVEAAIRSAGAEAGSSAPLAWLRFEPRRDSLACELTLDLWDGRGDAPRERLAWTHPHGLRVHWLAPGAPDRRAQAPPFEEDFALG